MVEFGIRRTHPRPLTMADASGGETMDERASTPLSDEILEKWLAIPSDRRMGALFEAFRRNWDLEKVREITGGITRWFLHRFQSMAAIEKEIVEYGKSHSIAELDECRIRKWKGYGFSDAHISDAIGGFSTTRELDKPGELTKHRHSLGIHPVFRMVDSCAAEFAAVTPYYYSTYEGGNANEGVDLTPQDKKDGTERIVVVGSGPIRIGQGIEFDYGCVHAVGAIRDMGHEAIIINNNPETVSTDFDTSDRLYFDPLTPESVMEILLRERADGILLQFGGQTAINLALPIEAQLSHLENMGVSMQMVGTSPDAVDEASDRYRFEEFAKKNNLRMPRGTTATDPISVRKAAENIGYPVLIRPSYVLGGRGMEVLTDDKQLEAYMQEAYVAPEKPLLVDEYLGNAIELDVDAVCDGQDVLIGAVMEHLEEAGIHSGDSTCFIPTQNVSPEILDQVEEWTRIIGLELGVIGCFNIQYAIKKDELYVLEVNPRGSRTFPFVAKSTGIPLARIAARLTMGDLLSDLNIPERQEEAVAVKAPVFPFIKLRGLDPAPGPEMKSTGEVMGSHKNAAAAYLKARMATEIPVPTHGGVYITVKDSDKESIIPLAKSLKDMEFDLYATRGTAAILRERGGLEVNSAYRIAEQGSPDALDLMRDGKIQLIINTPTNSGGAVLDGNMMRRLAVELNIPFVTTLSGATMEVQAVAEMIKGLPEPRSLTIGTV